MGTDEIYLSEFKKKVIRLLKEHQKSVKGFSLTESFVRGFIVGAEAMAGVKVPNNWYQEIVKVLQEE